MSHKSHKWFLVAAVGAVLIVFFMALLAMGGVMIMAFLRADQPGQHLGLAPFFCSMGTFFTFGLFLLLLVGAGRFFRVRAWRAAGGPRGERWLKHWHEHGGPMPPWCRGWEKPAEEEAEKAESGAKTGDVEEES